MDNHKEETNPLAACPPLTDVLAAVCKHCGDEIKLYGYLWLDSGKVFPQYCRASYGGQLHKAANAEVNGGASATMETKK